MSFPWFKEPLASSLIDEIRYKNPHNKTSLFKQFWRACLQQSEQVCCTNRFQFFEYIFDIYLETMCDTNINYRWRVSCLDNCYLPLGKMRAYSCHQNNWAIYKMKVNELATMSKFFLSNTHNDNKQAKFDTENIIRLTLM